MAVFITPVDVSTATTGSYVDIDVSANVPAGATAVIVRVVRSAASSGYFLRKNGSTDDLYSASQTLAYFHQWAVVAVDSSRIFEMKIEDTGVDCWLHGYLTTDCVMFTNATSKATATTGSYVDVDISGDTGADTAVAAIGFANKTSTNANARYTVRKNGSTDDFYGTDTTNGTGVYNKYFIIGVDGSEIFEQKIGNAAVDLYLAGYITVSCTMNTNATNRSLAATAAWTDLTALDTGAIGGIYQVVNTDATSSLGWGLRKNGSSAEDYANIIDVGYYAYTTMYGVVECDGSQLVEGKIEDTAVDFYYTGYFTAVAAATRRVFSIT
jgi:hypothetical protein